MPPETGTERPRAGEPCLDFELVIPDRRVIGSTPEMVVIPGAEGDFGALRGHAPAIAALRPGIVAVHAKFDDEPERWFVSGGFAEVGGGQCLVLADTAEPVSGIDAAEAEAEVKKAEAAVEKAPDDAARATAEAALEVARARRDAAG